MIFLTKGNTQTLGGLIVPGGSLQLVLQTDCTIIATPFGQVLSGIPKRFSFDSTGNLLGTCPIWSNAELSPSTGYLVNFYDADGARINANPFVWVFSQTIGQSVDIGTMVSTSTSGPSYSGAVLLAPTGNQTIATGNLILGTGDFNVSLGTYRISGVIPTGSGPLVSQTNATLITPNITGPGATFAGSTSGTLVIKAAAVSGSSVATFPNGSGTVILDGTTQTLSGKSLTSPIFLTGITPGSGLKHQRFGTTCTTGATSGNTCTTAYTWSVAFADASYTCNCWGGAGVGTNATLAINAKSASQITIVLQTNANVASSYGTVDCIAIHD